MSKFSKFALGISCFLPLFIIFFLENLWKAIFSYVTIREKTWLCSLFIQPEVIYYNAAMCGVWLLLTVIGSIGIRHFRKTFLKAEDLAKETVVLTKAENVTADYYFTYFSLFVISFFGVDPTAPKDALIFAFIMMLIIWVYMVNEMYFVNPVLNILGYKAFSITYRKESTANIKTSNEPECFEIKVFSKDYLNRMIGDTLHLTFSPHDFSVCRRKNQKK